MNIERTIFGPLVITEPVLVDLINTKAMQRLKHVNQFGISYYTYKPKKYTRYSHSLGVLHLLIKIGAPLEEQIAGLLHDVSHTVFSHVGDLVFEQSSPSNSYQDDIHQWYLEQTDIPEILNEYGLTVQSILHKNKHFTALEKDLPNVCADRLEYIIHEAFLEGLYTAEEVQELYQSSQFEGGHWVIHDKNNALKLATTALFLTKRHWAAPWNVASYHWGARALKRAMDVNILTEAEFHFGYDDDVWSRLKTSSDAVIAECFKKMMTCTNHFSADDEHGIHITPKFRGIDPIVKTDKGCQYLSHIDKSFENTFTILKDELQRGYYLKL